MNITIDERTFADLVIGWKKYAIVDKDVRDAVRDSSHLVCENDSDTVGWAGTAIGQVQDVSATDGLYRLWRRDDWRVVGNLARERATERERVATAADAKRKAEAKVFDDSVAKLRQTLTKQGINNSLIDKLLSDASQEDIRKMLGL